MCFGSTVLYFGVGGRSLVAGNPSTSAAAYAHAYWALPSTKQGDWSVASNWSGGIVPGSDDFVYFNGGGTATISLPGENCYSLSDFGYIEMANGSLSAGSEIVGTFIQSGGTNSVAGSLFSDGTYGLSGGLLSAGSESIGSFVQSGGTNSVAVSLIIVSGGTYGLSGGFLSGADVVIDPPNSVAFIPGGTLRIGGGTLSVIDGLSLSSGGTLNGEEAPRQSSAEAVRSSISPRGVLKTTIRCRSAWGPIRS